MLGRQLCHQVLNQSVLKFAHSSCKPSEHICPESPSKDFNGTFSYHLVPGCQTRLGQKRDGLDQTGFNSRMNIVLFRTFCSLLHCNITCFYISIREVFKGNEYLSTCVLFCCIGQTNTQSNSGLMIYFTNFRGHSLLFRWYTNLD